MARNQGPRNQGQEGHVVTVAKQEGQNALVAVPMVGFPDGFQLAPGARVVLVSTPSGAAVRPLVRAIAATVPQDALDNRDEPIDGGGRRVLQDATEVGDQPSAKGSSNEDVLWVVESSDAGGPEQVIAIRSASPERD
jgi:hypothetical protein